MGCSSSSTQTVAQENRPGTKPEEANGDTGFVAGNGTVAEDAETIADQMQLPVQSALPEELGPGPGDPEAPAACETLQNVDVVAELLVDQPATVSKPTLESDLPQAVEGSESTALGEPAACIEALAPLEERSPADVTVAEEVSVISAAVEEKAVVDAAAVADVLLTREAPAAEPLASTVLMESCHPVEAATEAQETSPALEVTLPPEATPAPTQTSVEDTTAPDSIPALEPCASAEPTTAPESTPVQEPTLLAECAPAPEPTHPAVSEPAVESATIPDSTPTESPVVAEAAPSATEELAAVQSQTELAVPEPVQVEAAEAAAKAVLQAAQEHGVGVATREDADTPVVQATEASDGGIEDIVSQALETEEAKIPVVQSGADMAAANEE